MLGACGGDPQPGHGEEHMKQISFALALSTLLFGTLAANAQARSGRPPPKNERRRAKGGAGDGRAPATHEKPQSVLNALKLVKTGKMIEPPHVLTPNMPFPGTRRFDVH